MTPVCCVAEAGSSTDKKKVGVLLRLMVDMCSGINVTGEHLSFGVAVVASVVGLLHDSWGVCGPPLEIRASFVA